MASRNEVLTLFGATPEQIMEKQRREQAAMVLSQQDPFARAGSAIGVGLARLFGGESADVLEARRLQGAREGLDLTTEEGMRNAAERLQAAGFEDRALQILDMADRKATAQQARDISQIKIIDKQITRPVTTVDEYGEKRTTAVKINVPHKFNILTDDLTPIFDEETMQAMAQEQAGIEVEVESKTPRQQNREAYLQQIDEIPVGQVRLIKNPSGNDRYVRRTGPGPNDVEIVPIEEIRQMPTELGTIGPA